MNLLAERENVVVMPKCSNVASEKSPSTVAGVAFCIASAWCELRHSPVSAVWHSAQVLAPTKLALSAACDGPSCPSVRLAIANAIPQRRRPLDRAGGRRCLLHDTIPAIGH